MYTNFLYSEDSVFLRSEVDMGFCFCSFGSQFTIIFMISLVRTDGLLVGV